MFWNREDEPFTVRQDPDYPRVFIKMHGKDIDGYIEEDDLDYLDDKSKVFTVRAEREHPITRERIGVITGVSIKLVEENDWYMKIEHKCNVLYETQPNLLEIKLKDTDSVPEVWYKGEKLGKYPECLVDISYHWNTGGMNDNGANDINIEYYSTPDDKHLDKKIIGHKRDM
ncbi:hypothetical protein [Enterococcus avium]|uniref:hypothetical protein n=1 Tax=Enterococcus avium TaxID=33945 RepID=UPI002890FE5A|nr:hypothetical protein [Enterococcus avium]MDT2457542.1 hypothetical protein [Enterococcus avium]